jgi:hypothetical protein
VVPQLNLRSNIAEFPSLVIRPFKVAEVMPTDVAGNVITVGLVWACSVVKEISAPRLVPPPFDATTR